VSSVKQRHEEEEDEIMRTTRAWDSTLEKRSRAPVVGRASVLTIQKQKLLREKASGCRRSHPWDPANQHIDSLITLLLLARGLRCVLLAIGLACAFIEAPYFGCEGGICLAYLFIEAPYFGCKGGIRQS
jgi:hypothetical protein